MRYSASMQSFPETPAGCSPRWRCARSPETCFGPVYGSLEYRAEMDSMMPDGWCEQALADLPNLFLYELPALREFAFGPQRGSHVRMPVLRVEGETTQSVFSANSRYLREWIPQTESGYISGSNHMCPVLKPAETARQLTDFWSRHPIATG